MEGHQEKPHNREQEVCRGEEGGRERSGTCDIEFDTAADYENRGNNEEWRQHAQGEPWYSRTPVAFVATIETDEA